MASLNKVLLMGNLTRDPELRYTAGGQAVCHFTVAVNREWKDKQSGEKKEEATFLRVTVWGKQGEHCAQYLAKGRAVFVEGRLQSRSWEQDGQKRSAVDVVADNVQFLGAKGAPAGGGPERAETEAPADAPPAEDDIPF